MAVPPTTSPSLARGAASPPPPPPSKSSSRRTSIPFRQRLWPFPHAKPVNVSSNGPPPAAPAAPYVPQHAASDFIRTTTPKPQVMAGHHSAAGGNLYRRGDNDGSSSINDFSLFISEAHVLDQELIRRQRARIPPSEEALRQSRNQGGVVRRIADYVKPPRDG